MAIVQRTAGRTGHREIERREIRTRNPGELVRFLHTSRGLSVSLLRPHGLTGKPLGCMVAEVDLRLREGLNASSCNLGDCEITTSFAFAGGREKVVLMKEVLEQMLRERPTDGVKLMLEALATLEQPQPLAEEIRR